MAVGVKNQQGVERQRDRDDTANLPGSRPRCLRSYNDAIVAADYLEMKEEVGAKVLAVH